MLENVIVAYLDRVEEREFDQPLMALLRGLGYTEVHLVHGSVEFGKDVIARRADGRQCAFQSKAGDLNLSQWQSARNQIEEIRNNPVSHPAFDAAAPRTGVLVTTGQLTGQANISAQAYAQQMQQHGFSFELWDRDKLLALLVASPEVGLATGTSASFTSLASAIELGRTTDRDIEIYSRNWIVLTEQQRSLYRSTLEASVLGAYAERAERLDLACTTSLALLRAAATAAHNQDPIAEPAATTAESAVHLFSLFAHRLWSRCGKESLTPDDLVLSHPREFAMFVTYPVRCMRVAEIIGLYALLLMRQGDELGDRIAQFLADFLVLQRGAAHPISNRWAASIAPAVLASARAALHVIPWYLEQVTAWTCNWYDRPGWSGLGLAAPDATPEDEVAYLLRPLLGIELPRHGDSYIQTTLLDLAVILDMPTEYALLRNEFRAVEATASAVESDDTEAQYQHGVDGLRFAPALDYSDEMSAGLPPSHSAPAPFLVRIGRAWEHLAITTLLRDRHSVAALRSLATIAIRS